MKQSTKSAFALLVASCGSFAANFASAAETVVAFQKQIIELGNQCELVSYKDQPHGFFNPGRGPKDNPHQYYIDTLNRTDAFLVSLKYLSSSVEPAKTPR